MKKYDDSSATSIESYAKMAVGKSFIEIYEGEDSKYDYEAFNKTLNSGKNKGSLGQLVEKYYFGYENNSDQLPDFPKAGVELKVSPYIKNNNGSISAKERLIITIINYMTVIEETFEVSHVFLKLKSILLMEYQHIKDKNKADFVIDYAGILHIPEKDLIIIKKDFEYIVNKIKEGQAHNLSEADTLYMGACTKGASAESVRDQPYSSTKAKQRAFCLKQSYMTYILRNYIFNDGVEEKESLSESIIKTKDEAKNFEELITKKITRYKGMSFNNLIKKFNLENLSSKNKYSTLAFRMLDIKNNRAEEFEKANIVVKTIRLEADNSMKEDMSFKNFKFTEVVKEEEWEDSELYKLWGTVKFLFVIFKTNDSKNLKNKNYYLYDCQLWNIPGEDLNKYGKEMWLKLKSVINNGIKVEVRNNRQFNNLPKKSENIMCHIRPKGTDSSCKYPLPNGEKFTKQCYWLNNSYILSQLKCISCHNN